MKETAASDDLGEVATLSGMSVEVAVDQENPLWQID